MALLNNPPLRLCSWSANGVLRNALLLVFVALLVWRPVAAGIPSTINYQAQITEQGCAGAACPQVFDLVFTLYFDAAGTQPAGWTETHLNVQATDSIVDVELGAITPFPVDLFEQPLYLGVAVNNDPEMTPRMALHSVPYALQAESAITLDGSTVVELDQSADIQQLMDVIDALQNQVNALEQQVIDLQAGSNAALQIQVTALEQRVDELEQQVNDAEGGLGTVADLFNVLSIDGTEVIFSGVNVLINNGSDQQDVLNGLGNLVIGYNAAGDDPVERGGSHNLVVGEQNNYSSHSGIVSGFGNTISGPHANAIGGGFNMASGLFASVFGGGLNIASGEAAVVVGGQGNQSSDVASSVFGGESNVADGRTASVLGGLENTASGLNAVIAGGNDNEALGVRSTVVGANGATALDDQGYISPNPPQLANLEDILQDVSRDGDTVLFSGVNVQIVNGTGNTDNHNSLGNLIIGYNVPSGSGNERTGSHNIVVGDVHDYTAHSGIVAGRKNKITAAHASVLAGNLNEAGAENAAVLGGQNNHATGAGATVSGGVQNLASGQFAHVSGGSANQATGNISNVSGGVGNVAGQNFSSIPTGRLVRSGGE